MKLSPGVQNSKIAWLAGILFVLASTSAQAQSWWFGPNTVYDKSVVKFSKKYKPGEIIVSFGDRRLYHVLRQGEAMSYPIAVPREESRWQGVLRVTQKRVNPGWTPTASMRKENPELPAHVPGGDPLNPLGVRALYLGSTLYRIHGTDAPWTIGENVSKGCVRMHNEHVVELYDQVKIGARVTATWTQYSPTTVASTNSGWDGYGDGPEWRPF